VVLLRAKFGVLFAGPAELVAWATWAGVMLGKGAKGSIKQLRKKNLRVRAPEGKERYKLV